MDRSGNGSGDCGISVGGGRIVDGEFEWLSTNRGSCSCITVKAMVIVWSCWSCSSRQSEGSIWWRRLSMLRVGIVGDEVVEL